jgi:putative membrane protein
MIRAVVQVVVNGIALLVASYLVPGVHYEGGLLYLLLAGLVIGLVNLLVKPLVTVLSLPLVIVTLGLFYLVINGLMFWLAAWLLDGLSVDGCLPAVLGGLVIAVFNWLVRAFARGEE